MKTVALSALFLTEQAPRGSAQWEHAQSRAAWASVRDAHTVLHGRPGAPDVHTAEGLTNWLSFRREAAADSQADMLVGDAEAFFWALALSLPRPKREGMAREARHLGLTLDEARHELALALFEAALRYSPGRGTRFSTFARWGWRSRKRQLRAAHGHTTRASQAIARDAERLAKVVDQLGPDAAIEHVLSAAQLTHSRLAQICLVSHQPLPITSGGDLEAASLLEDRDLPTDEAVDVERLVLAHQLQAIAEDELPPEQWRALRLRLGLDGGPPRTLREVGEDMGFGKDKAKTLIFRAITHLRRRGLEVFRAE